MKYTKILSHVLIIACAMIVSACEEYDDTTEIQRSQSAEASATFNISLATDILCRNDNSTISDAVFGSGANVTNLYYAAYSDNILVDTNYGETPQPVVITNRAASFPLRLTPGNEYTVVFWAQSPKATQYTFDTDNAAVHINTSNLLCNDENADAFFGSVTFMLKSDDATTNVTLSRPFAQLNFGATDYRDAADLNYSVHGTQFTIPNMPTTLRLVDGKAADYVASATFANNATPAQQNAGVTFPEGVDAQYIAMAYIPVDKTSTLVDVDFDFDQKSTQQTYTNIPLTRGYSTNIYGDFLTATYTATVNINPSYNN